MALASQLPYSKYADAQPAHRRSGFPLLALLPLIAAALVPASARADLYQWTDEEGRTVISDMLPVDPGKVSGMKLLARASKAVAAQPATISPPAADAKQQELEARVAELERQLQEQQSAPPPPAQASDGGGYYPAPPAPEPSNYVTEYKTVYYPVPYYVSPPVYSVIVAPARPALYRPHPAHRPASAPRPVFVSRPQFTGPTPQFTGPTPQFTGPTPRFVDPALQIVYQQGSANSTRNAVTPRPVQRDGLIRAQR